MRGTAFSMCNAGSSECGMTGSMCGGEVTFVFRLVPFFKFGLLVFQVCLYMYSRLNVLYNGFQL